MTRPEFHATLFRIQGTLYAVVLVICIALLGLIVISITAAVFARFVIFTPLNFADPLSKYLMQWLAFLGIGLAMSKGEHVLVSGFSDRLSVKSQRVLAVIISLAVAVLFAVIMVFGWQYAMSGWTSNDPFVFGLPMVVPYLSVPAGALYAVVQAFLTIGLCLSASDGESPLPSATTQGI